MLVLLVTPAARADLFVQPSESPSFNSVVGSPTAPYRFKVVATCQTPPGISFCIGNDPTAINPSIVPAYGGDFTIVENGCPATLTGTDLMGSATCGISVRFTPSVFGISYAELDVGTGFRGPAVANLAGVGEFPPDPGFHPKSALSSLSKRKCALKRSFRARKKCRKKQNKRK